jgi:hypothetical protein
MHMKQLFKFTFYGLDCRSTSNSALFMELLRSKFELYKKNETEELLGGKILIQFRNSETTLPSSLGNKISNTTTIGNNFIKITHRYLTTSADITIFFKKDVLTKIVIVFKSAITFSVVNALLLNVLRRQLFQQIIKLYIEQTLYWYVADHMNLQCIHASAVEKNGKVLVFAGLNGVGKSTLAQLLIKNYNYHFFADNYVLINESHAFFSPDTVRLDKRSLSMLEKNATHSYGFNKFSVKTTNNSAFKKALIAKVYFVSQGKKWQKIKLSRSKFWEKLFRLLSINGELASLAPVAQFNPQNLRANIMAKKAQCFDLIIGTNQQFKESYI